MTTTTSRTSGYPDTTEYSPYWGRYISLVKGDDVEQVLVAQLPETLALFSQFSEQQGDHRYAPGKWSVKEVVGHLSDSERILAYRALRIARADKTPIEGFEQDDYVANGPFSQVSLAALIEEFTQVRKATVLLFRNFTGDEWTRRGIANNLDVTVRAAAYTIAGHELHHRRILQERYLQK